MAETNGCQTDDIVRDERSNLFLLRIKLSDPKTVKDLVGDLLYILSFFDHGWVRTPKRKSASCPLHLIFLCVGLVNNTHFHATIYLFLM